MNQILEYSPNKSSGGGTSGSDKIVRVFAIILIIFALCFIIIGAYGAFKKNKVKTDVSASTQTQAQIDIETTDSTALIKVSHDKSIEKVIYNWDNDKETTEKGNGTSEKEIEVPLPAGQHTLNVKVIDIDGVETSFKKTITSENGTDIINPVIDITVTPDKKIRITATDETEIAYVTYKWNDDEEQRVDVEEDKKKIEFDIEILRGNNDLTVVAVDANNRTTTESKSFAGVTKPEVRITVAPDKKMIHVDCLHENGLKEVSLKVNDTVRPVAIGDDNPKEIGFDYNELPEGNATITVTATSVDDTVTEATEEIIPDAEPEEGANQNIHISITKSETDPTKALIIVSYEQGIKEIGLNINDVDYPISGLGDDNPTELSLEPPLVEGNNRITVTITGADNTQNSRVEEILGE